MSGVGKYEQRVLDRAVRESYKSRREFADAEFEPEIKITETSRAGISCLYLERLRQRLKDNEVFILMSDEVAYAMLVPVSFTFLLEVRDLLREDIRFMVAPDTDIEAL